MRSQQHRVKKYDSPRQQERERTILRVAREMLDEVGFERMALADLASRAGVARATLYNLFGNKDALTVAAIRDSLESINERVAGIEPVEGIDALLAISQSTSEELASSPNYSKEMVRLLVRPDVDSALLENLYKRPRSVFAEQLKVSQQKGELEQWFNADVLSQQIHHLGWGVILAWTIGDLNTKQMMEHRKKGIVQLLFSVSRGDAKKRLSRLVEM